MQGGLPVRGLRAMRPSTAAARELGFRSLILGSSISRSCCSCPVRGSYSASSLIVSSQSQQLQTPHIAAGQLRLRAWASGLSAHTSPQPSCCGGRISSHADIAQISDDRLAPDHRHTPQLRPPSDLQDADLVVSAPQRALHLQVADLDGDVQHEGAQLEASADAHSGVGPPGHGALEDALVLAGLVHLQAASTGFR